MSEGQGHPMGGHQAREQAALPELKVKEFNPQQSEKEKKKKGGFLGRFFGGAKDGSHAMLPHGGGGGLLGFGAGGAGPAGLFGALSSFLGSGVAKLALGLLLGLGVAATLALLRGGGQPRSGGVPYMPNARGPSGGINSFSSLGFLKYANPDVNFAGKGSKTPGAEGSSQEAPGAGDPNAAPPMPGMGDVPPAPTLDAAAQQGAEMMAASAGDPGSLAAAAFKQMGKLSTSVGGGGAPGAGGKASATSGQLAGISTGGFRNIQTPVKAGRLGDRRRLPVRPLGKRGGVRGIGVGARAQLGNIAGMNPAQQATAENAAATGSGPFDNSASLGGAGLNTGGAGVVNSPSAGNEPTASGGTGSGRDTNPDFAKQQKKAQEDSKAGTGMMIIGVLLLIAGLALIAIGASNPELVYLVYIGMALVLLAFMMAMMGMGKGKQAKDAGKKLDEQGQTSAAQTADQMGESVESAGAGFGQGSGQQAQQGVQQAVDQGGQNIQSHQHTPGTLWRCSCRGAQSVSQTDISGTICAGGWTWTCQ